MAVWGVIITFKCNSMTTLDYALFFLLVTWIPFGFAIGLFKVSVWEHLFIKNRQALQLNPNKWRITDKFLLFILWPRQTSRWLMTAKNFYGTYYEAIPIIPFASFEPQKSSRSINFSLIQGLPIFLTENENNQIWIETSKGNLVKEWFAASMLLSWSLLASWVINFIFYICILTSVLVCRMIYQIFNLNH